MNGRLIVILIALLFGLAFLTLLCFLTIYLAPNVFFNPLSPARATAAAATRSAGIPVSTATEPPPATYPPTWTPTLTFTPAPTKTPTETRTPTPTRTNTATPTDTATFTPTPAPPTDTPTTTATPTPFPYFVAAHSGLNNCADIGLWGMVAGADGLPLPGVSVQYGEFNVPNSRFLATTDFNGRFDVLLVPGSNRAQASVSHTWYAFVVSEGQQQSEVFLFETDPIYADNPDICDRYDPNDDDLAEDDEGNEVDEDEEEEIFREEGCIPDPCQVSDSIQIKVIDWQERGVGSSFVPIEPPSFSIDDFSCADFTTQAAAQEFYEESGGPTLDVYGLDPDRDGIACEGLP